MIAASLCYTTDNRAPAQIAAISLGGRFVLEALVGNGTVHRSSSYWEMGLEALDFKNYVAVNYTLIRKYGLHAAVLIGELASEARYYKRNSKLSDGWFFSTVENVEEHTGLNAYYQREALKTLQDIGFLEIKYSGLPRKRYFRIDAMRVIEEMSANEEIAGQEQCSTQLTTSDATSEPLVAGTVDDNNCNEQPEQTTKKKERKKPAETYDSIIDSYTDNGELRSALAEFVKMRKMMKKPLTSKALSLLLTSKKGLDGLASTDAEKIDIVNQTIMHSWQGFFPLKDIEAKKNTAPHETSSGFNRKIDADYYYQSSGDEELDKVLGLGKYAPKTR